MSKNKSFKILFVYPNLMLQTTFPTGIALLSAKLKENGYDIIPVNPGHSEIAGLTSYPSLLDIPSKVDIVDVFRRSEHVMSIVEDTIKINAKALWLQDGVINEDAQSIAKVKKLLFIMNDCMLRRHRQFKHNV